MSTLTQRLAAEITPTQPEIGGSFLSDLLGQALWVGYVIAILAIIAGAATLGWVRSGHGGATQHSMGGRLLGGGILGLMLLIGISAFTGGVL